MQITRKITLDIDKNIYTTIDAKQNDADSRFIEFTLVNNGLPLDLTGHSVKVYAIKADNKIIFNNLSLSDAINGKCILELTTQALAVVGNLECELVIYGTDNSILSSKVFTINVIESIRNDSAIESINEFTALTEGITKLNQWDLQFQGKYDGLEVQYATDLTQVKTSLNEKSKQSDLNTTNNNVANNTSSINALNSQVATHTSQIAGLASGAPKAVSLVSQIIDTTKNYVYTGTETGYTAGNWYYWNGSTWASGGVYQSTGLANKGVTPEKTSFYQLNFTPNFTINYYINYSNGANTYLANSYHSTDWIPFDYAGLNFIINTATYNDAGGLAFYDVNKNYISGIATGTNNTLKTTEFTTPPKTKFIRFTCYGANNLSSVYIAFSDNAISLVNKSNSRALEPYMLKSDIVTSILLTFTYGKYPNIASGDISTAPSNDFGYVAIPVIKGERYYITGTHIDYQALYILKDSNGTVVDKYPTTNTAQATETKDYTVSSNGTLYIGRYLTDSTLTKYPLYSIPSDLLAYPQNYDYLRVFIRKVLCIGDSITDGAYYDPVHNGASIKENYPYMLANMSGWTVDKKSQSGYSASDWWVHFNGTVDFTLYDTVIICLGTNNGLTDTLNTDAVGSDYNTYANTETGYYAKIVASILVANPNCHVFLCRIFASKGNVATTNSVIEQIATRWNCGILDDRQLYGNSIYHPFGNSVHYGKVGNVFRAKTFYQQILSYINDNQSKYEVLLDEQ